MELVAFWKPVWEQAQALSLPLSAELEGVFPYSVRQMCEKYLA